LACPKAQIIGWKPMPQEGDHWLEAKCHKAGDHWLEANATRGRSDSFIDQEDG
jgi:hypothetical protein